MFNLNFSGYNVVKIKTIYNIEKEIEEMKRRWPEKKKIKWNISHNTNMHPLCNSVIKGGPTTFFTTSQKNNLHFVMMASNRHKRDTRKVQKARKFQQVISERAKHRNSTLYCTFPSSCTATSTTTTTTRKPKSRAFIVGVI